MTMSESKYVGIDGCKAGWFSVGLDDSDGYELVVFSEFSQVIEHYTNAELILVDMPIGMVELTDDTHGGRRCEREARKIAGSRVFPTRSRDVVYEVSQIPRTQYSQAQMRAKSLNELGNFKRGSIPGITKQSHEITPKIVQLDQTMIEREKTESPAIREVHPEICFWALNSKKPLSFAKHTKEGRCERVNVLKCHFNNRKPKKICAYACLMDSQFYDFTGQKYRKFLKASEVARDDILDALVAAVTAKLGWPCNFKTLPECPPKDSKGLPMEMVYVEVDSSTPQ